MVEIEAPVCNASALYNRRNSVKRFFCLIFTNILFEGCALTLTFSLRYVLVSAVVRDDRWRKQMEGWNL